MESAFESCIQTGIIENDENFIDPREFLRACQPIILRKWKFVLKRLKSIKCNLIFTAQYVQPVSEEESFKHFTTSNVAILQASDHQEALQRLLEQIYQRMDEFSERGSGWALKTVCNLTICINKYDALNARYGTFIDLPNVLKRKNAIINVKNRDNRCFAWAILSQMFPAQQNIESQNAYPQDVHSFFNFKGIQFPVKLNDISKFEKLNQNISINVFGLALADKNTTIVPIYIIQQEKDMHANLLYLQNSNNRGGHYFNIKNLSRLCRNQITKHTVTTHICTTCLNHFSSEDKLNQHKVDCSCH